MGERVLSVRLHLGDCLDVMPTMDAESVDSIVTDPPYGLSFMGKDWDHGIPGIRFWREALRIAKPGAHLLAFGGTRTFHRLACAIEDAGWEIRDTVMWVYGSGFPKSHNIGKKLSQWDGWGTALKPAWEPIILARKPFRGTVAENVLQHGTGGLNVDACRIPGTWERSTTTRCDIRGGRTVGGNSGGLECEPQSAHVSGRWPANVIHDGSDEVTRLFPVTGGGTWNRTNGARHFNNNGEPTGYQTSGKDTTTGSAARFFYCAKASKSDRDEGCDGLEARPIRPTYSRQWGSHDIFNTPGNGRNTDNKPRRNHHPTVKPTDLMRYLCRLVTPPGGIVLDPFMGSGSTGKAAIAEGFSFVGIEQDAEYIDIAERRIAYQQSVTEAERMQLALLAVAHE